MVRQGHAPRTLEEALSIREKEKCCVIAGGTDVMVKHARYSGLAPGLPLPPLFISGVEELSGISTQDDTVTIGATTSLTEIMEGGSIPDSFKSVLMDFASPAIRNCGTIGGNICNASPAGDTLPYLIANDAVVSVRSSGSQRTLPLADFITGPGTTCMRDDELLVSVSWERRPVTSYLWRKIGQRKANALSKASVYAQWNMDEKQLLNLAVGGTAPLVVRSTQAEDIICNVIRAADPQDTQESFNRAIELINDGLSPISDQRSTASYRKETVLRIILRLFNTLTQTGSKTDD